MIDKKTQVLKMGIPADVSLALQTLDKAGVQTFVEIVDTRNDYAREHGYPKNFELHFYTLDPSGI